MGDELASLHIDAEEASSFIDSVCKELGIFTPRARRACNPTKREWPPPCPSGKCDTRGCVCPPTTRSAQQHYRDAVNIIYGSDAGSAQTAETPQKRAGGQPRKLLRTTPEPTTGTVPTLVDYWAAQRPAAPPAQPRSYVLDGDTKATDEEITRLFASIAPTAGETPVAWDLWCYERLSSASRPASVVRGVPAGSFGGVPGRNDIRAVPPARTAHSRA